MGYEFTSKRSDRAYITNNLVLPKEGLNLAPVKAALTFVYGEEEVRDEIGELLFTRTKQMKLWDENRHHIIVPREFFDEASYDKFDFEFEDQRPHQFPEVEIEDNIILRDTEQEEAFEALTDNHSGTLWLACGKGKSVLALKLAATLKVPTIIVVNSTALLEQWKLEIEKFLGVDSVGVIQGKIFDWEHPIVVATVQTLARNRERWPMRFRRWFGLTLYDEGHHMSAPTFVRSADLFFGRRYSLTATANRTDGLEVVYQHHIGRVIYKNLEQELIPLTFFHRLKWTFDEKYTPRIVDTNGDIHLSRLRTYLGELDWRNEIIYDHLLQDLGDQRQMLVLSHIRAHVERMYEQVSLRLRASGNLHNPGIITGKTKGNRIEILRECNPVFGTFQLAREALDKQELDTLYVTTPFSNDNDAQQSWGRTQRILDGKKEPLIRVYEDLAFDKCTSACRNVRSRLKKINYPYVLENMEVDLED